MGDYKSDITSDKNNAGLQTNTWTNGAMSARVKTFLYQNQEIVLVDFSNLDAATVKLVAEDCRRLVATRPHASVLTLVDVTGCKFDKEAIKVCGDLAVANKPYVTRSAVLGVHGLIQFAFNAIVALAQREMRLFDKREDALKWLTA